jgi:tartrate dehydrogenase/decarboxylase/D-malate dehydrogenase
MGKGIANPIGTYWSSVMMLENLGEFSAAQRLMNAIEKLTLEKRVLSHDLGGNNSTEEITAEMINILSRKND